MPNRSGPSMRAKAPKSTTMNIQPISPMKEKRCPTASSTTPTTVVPRPIYSQLPEDGCVANVECHHAQKQEREPRKDEVAQQRVVGIHVAPRLGQGEHQKPQHQCQSSQPVEDSPRSHAVGYPPSVPSPSTTGNDDYLASPIHSSNELS